MFYIFTAHLGMNRIVRTIGFFIIKFYINGNIQFLSFSKLLLGFRIMFLRFIHVDISILFILTAEDCKLEKIQFMHLY